MCKNCPISFSEEKKKIRGEYNYSFANEIKAGITTWKDNRLVSVASNFCAVDPLKRRQKGAKIQVKVPFSVEKYSKNMGGVDLSDWNVEKYRASIGGFKWYFKIVTYCFDMMVVNAWALHKIVFGSTTSNLEFRR